MELGLETRIDLGVWGIADTRSGRGRGAGARVHAGAEEPAGVRLWREELLQRGAAAGRVAREPAGSAPQARGCQELEGEQRCRRRAKPTRGARVLGGVAMGGQRQGGRHESAQERGGCVGGEGVGGGVETEDAAQPGDPVDGRWGGGGALGGRFGRSAKRLRGGVRIGRRVRDGEEAELLPLHHGQRRPVQRVRLLGAAAHPLGVSAGPGGRESQVRSAPRPGRHAAALLRRQHHHLHAVPPQSHHDTARFGRQGSA
eukprot:1311065-Rhodomonas_salina.2